MIYFTSDTHFGHRNVIQYCNRPFADVAQMDESLMDNWNNKITWDDEVYFLGDLTIGRSNTQLKAILARLTGNKYLIKGNHDNKLSNDVKAYFHGGAYDYLELPGLLDNSWWVAAHERENETGHSLPIVLCHYPMLEWNQSHRGSWQLHGHSHGKLEPNPRRQYDVGVDSNNYAPVSLDDLMVIMRNREVRKHHGNV